MPRLNAFLDRLHATPLGEFVRVRKELAAELRARGDAEAAARLAAVKKPPVTAWALNQVALEEPAALTAVAHATEKLAAAQRRALAGGGGGADAFREASRELHARIAEVVGKARAAARKAGKSPSVAQLRRVQRSLQALPFAAPEEVERLSRGHLEADLDAPAAFDLLGAGAKAHPPRTTHERERDHDHGRGRGSGSEGKREREHARERGRRDDERTRAREHARAEAAARRRERAQREEARRAEKRLARERARAEKHAATLERRALALEKKAAALAAAAAAAARRARDARRDADDAARATPAR